LTSAVNNDTVFSAIVTEMPWMVAVDGMVNPKLDPIKALVFSSVFAGMLKVANVELLSIPVGVPHPEPEAVAGLFGPWVDISSPYGIVTITVTETTLQVVTEFKLN
jgi:hypothetical protein